MSAHNPTRTDNRMMSVEKRAIVALSMIYAVRMLGLFMLIPVMALYVEQFPGSTATLTGIAIGIYGLTQALLQIPVGWLSDRYGRRLVITLGLCIFFSGSLVAAYADNISVLILGRAMQGAGAISAAVMALLADSTRDHQRSVAMAIIGASIGAAFIVALITGPAIYAWIGGRGLFLFTAGLAATAIVILWVLMPHASLLPNLNATTEMSGFRLSILLDRRYLVLNSGIFALHATLTASFIAIPSILRDTFSVVTGHHWLVYLVVMGTSMFFVLPGLMLAERRGRGREFMFTAAVLMILSLIWLGFIKHAIIWLVMALVLFFTGFNVLEAMLPSTLSRLAVPQYKGLIMGVFSTSQFLGTFTGGLLGGAILEHWGVRAMFMAGSGIIACWLLGILSLVNAGSGWQQGFKLRRMSDSNR